MKKKAIWILLIAMFTSVVFAVTHIHMAYLNYTCRGCMTVPHFQDSKDNSALIAIYRATDSSISDTLFLSKALIHGDGYQYYSDEFFPGITGELKNRISELKSDRHLTSFVDGKNSGYGLGLSILPPSITCQDSTGQVVATFELKQKFLENVTNSKGRKYLREWITILKAYN